MLKKPINKTYEHTILCINSGESTNNYAIKYANIIKKNRIDVFYSRNQLKGRGLSNNIWHSENNKNLTFSMSIGTDKITADCQFLLTICISLCIKKICDQYSNKKFSIKWPNDIYYKDKKIAGILIENTIMGNRIVKSIIGVGLNINQTEFDDIIPNPISLKQICDKEFDILEILEDIIEEFKQNLSKIDDNNTDDLWQQYHNALYRKDKMAKYSIDNKLIEGKIRGVDKYGRLKLNTKESEHLLNYKEIKFIL